MRTGVGGATLRFDFRLFDSADAAVTTAVSGDFTKLLTIDGVDDATAITVTHVATGRYTVTFTAPAVAAGSKKYVSCFVSHSTNAPRGFAEDFEVVNADTSTGVAQTGDSFARIGATGSSLTSLAQASVATEARLARLDENVSAAKTLTTAERDSVAAAHLDLTNGVLTGVTPRQALVAGHLVNAAGSSGQTASGGTALFSQGGKTLQAALDECGNRSSGVASL